MNQNEKTDTARFSLGGLFCTPGAIEAMREAKEHPLSFFKRHISGDWGEVDEHDRQENELSVLQGFRILSAYRTRLGTKLWVITEADRSSSTILLPEEY